MKKLNQINNNMDLSFQRLVSAACGSGFVILCESEYLCWKLFKRRNMFFFVCQLAIISSAIANALMSVIYFASDLRQLPMLIVLLLVIFVMIVSYPIMMLLRLRIIYNFHFLYMFIPVMQGILCTILLQFWIKWTLTKNNHDYRIYSIIGPFATISTTVQNIAINVFFIILAKKKFTNTIHVKNVIIINIIVILLECLVVITEFLFSSIWTTAPISYQIRVRLELSVLVYIVEPYRTQVASQIYCV